MANFDHDRPASTGDYEHHDTAPGRATIHISKVGSGTPGRAYTGAWHYKAEQDSRTIIEGSDLETNTPTTHAEAAEILRDMLGL